MHRVRIPRWNASLVGGNPVCYNAARLRPCGSNDDLAGMAKSCFMVEVLRSFPRRAPIPRVRYLAEVGMLTDVVSRSGTRSEGGHTPGSAVIPLDELAGHLGELPEGREIVVVCVSGV